MALQFRRGTAAEVVSESFVPEIGEPLYITDTQELYIGDGVTEGGIAVGGGGGGGGGGGTLEGLSDTTLLTERVNTIVSYSITSNVATINLATTHEYWYYTNYIATISNSSTAILNGTHTIIGTPNNSSFQIALTAADIGTTLTDGDTNLENRDGDSIIYYQSLGGWINFNINNWLTNPLFSNPHTLSYDLNLNYNDITSPVGSSVTINPGTGGDVLLKGNTTDGAARLSFACEQNSHWITIKGAPHSAAATYTLVLPETSGSANELLKTDGNGNLGWTTLNQQVAWGFTGTAPVSSQPFTDILGKNFGVWQSINYFANNGPGMVAADPTLVITFQSATGKFTDIPQGRYLVTFDVVIVIDNVTPSSGTELVHSIHAENAIQTYYYDSIEHKMTPLPYTSYGSSPHKFSFSLTAMFTAEEASPSANFLWFNMDQVMDPSYYVEEARAHFVRLGAL